jgi:hypothetical protein
MSNGSDETLDRIAQSLEGIALAFLGPREAFTKVDSGQLKGVIEKVLNEIWAPVKSELEKFKSSSGASSTLAAPVRGGSPTLATPVRGGQAAFFPGSGIPGDIVIQVGGVITFFDARAEARSRLIKLLPPVEAEIRFLCPLRIALKDTDTEPISTLCTSLSDTAVNFDPDKAQEVQEVYLEVARRTTEVTGRTREGLNGVKDFLAQFNIKFEGEFKPAQDALEKLKEEDVRNLLKPVAA